MVNSAFSIMCRVYATHHRVLSHIAPQVHTRITLRFQLQTHFQISFSKSLVLFDYAALNAHFSPLCELTLCTLKGEIGPCCGDERIKSYSHSFVWEYDFLHDQLIEPNPKMPPVRPSRLLDQKASSKRL